MSFPKYTLPETILTGIDVSAEHVVDDQISDSEHHFNSVLHKTGDDVRSSGKNFFLCIVNLKSNCLQFLIVHVVAFNSNFTLYN
jgi:hypothetical protein